MEIITGLVGLAAGAGLMWLVLRGTYAAQLASIGAERDVLRERIVDLEADAQAGVETAVALAPLREALSRMERQVAVLEKERAEQYGALGAQLSAVADQAGRLGSETALLSGALRHSAARGSWGEVQLRRVLESLGMLRFCDFEEQVSTSAGRPDVVVRLPGGRSLVIDAKAPMDAFLAAHGDGMAAADAAALMVRHAAALRGHVETLATKAYWAALPGSPELVICFVPGEAMLAAALTADAGLLEYAASRKVALACPSTLVAMLRTTASMWQQQALAENAAEVQRLGRELYERINGVAGHVTKLGLALRGSVETYNKMVGSIESRLMVTGRKFADLGVVENPPVELVPIETGPRSLSALELTEAS